MIESSTAARAKQVIVEILRQADRLDKLRLYKAFYHAHVIYAQRQPGFLSAWPIARMPRGPGIDAGHELLKDLKAADAVIQDGTGDSAEYRLGTAAIPGEALPAEALAAIRDAVAIVRDQTPEQASEHTHATSRTWREGRNGEIQNVYLDSIPDDEYRSRQDALAEMDQIIRSSFGEQSR